MDKYEKLLSDKLCGLKSELDVRNIPKGEIADCTDRKEGALGIVLSGKLRAKNAAGTKKVLLRTFAKGEIFGVPSLFSNGESQSTEFTALADSAVAFAGEDRIEKLIREDPDFAVTYIKFLSGKIRVLNGKISEYTSKTAADKLYLYVSECPRGVLENPDMAKLARILGIGRGSLYRAKDELIAAGKIVSDGKNLKIKENV